MNLGGFMSTYPVASSCPQCGSNDFTRVKVEGRVAFTDDRKCKACGTRYTPPTPAWAAVVFILLGILITVVGAAFFFFARKAVVVRDLVYGGILTVFGLSCIIYGIRCLRRRDASVPAEPQSGSKEQY
jgi:uncharacterized protein (DUF983 family)